ncbi:hypothetical protein GCM10019060_27290 [Novosphingobium pokkalii]|nr:hypothetical protein GCM10019060_27290 [Novosphingobium pokkalii]
MVLAGVEDYRSGASRALRRNYLRGMTTITTRHDQRHAAAAAKRVGGYSELIRLSRERARSGSATVVARNPVTGRWSIKSSSNA